MVVVFEREGYIYIYIYNVGGVRMFIMFRRGFVFHVQKRVYIGDAVWFRFAMTLFDCIIRSVFITPSTYYVSAYTIAVMRVVAST
jgi:hypothetical protein